MPQTTGDRIRTMRHKQKMTQAKLAEAAGVCLSQVADWERGQFVPKLANLRKLAAGLRCKLDALI